MHARKRREAVRRAGRARQIGETRAKGSKALTASARRHVAGKKKKNTAVPTEPSPHGRLRRACDQRDVGDRAPTQTRSSTHQNRPRPPSPAPAAPARRTATTLRRAEPPAAGDDGGASPSAGGKDFYNDERPLPPRTEMSDAYKKKLRDEYLALGGSANTAMGANYFLWIIVGISVLAVATWLTGAI